MRSLNLFVYTDQLMLFGCVFASWFVLFILGSVQGGFSLVFGRACPYLILCLSFQLRLKVFVCVIFFYRNVEGTSCCCFAADDF